MKQKTRSILLLFFICLVVVPSFIYGMSTGCVEAVSHTSKSDKVLTKIVVTPKEVKVPKDANEKCFKSLIKVEAYYKKVEEPTIVTDYVTNFNSIQNKTGTKRVTIQYTENGCTKKATVCVSFCEGETITPEVKPSPTPSETPVVTPPGTSSEDADINFPYISGYTDETFKPNQPVTREELATMMARLITKNRIPKEANQFKDLSTNRYSTDAINYITKLGIMKPVAKDQFNPNGTVTDQEFKEIVGRLAPYIKDEKVQLPKGEGKLTRVQAVVAFNKLFNVQCNTTMEGDIFKDVNPNTPYYEDIRCATQRRVQPRS